MNTYPEKMYDLLENYSFQQLSEADTDFVLQYVTEVEYEKMKRILEKSKAGFDSSVSRMEIPANLLHLVAEKKRSAAIPMWKRSIALYKVAAAILLPLLLTIFYYEQFRVNKTTSNLISSIDTVYVKGATDTVYIPAERKKNLENKQVRTQVVKNTHIKEEIEGSVPLSEDTSYRIFTSSVNPRVLIN